MADIDFFKAIPGQHDGAEITSKSSVDKDTVEEAKALFEKAKQRLLDVNRWHETAEGISGTFVLTDPGGREYHGNVKEGLHFKIDIPGPGSPEGHGYDWVLVENVESFQEGDFDGIAITVRPSEDPTSSEDEVAHFYSPESTSTFTVAREGKTVQAAIYDRNTKPNTENHSLPDKIRNAVVGAVGIAAFSKIQWNNLTDGLLK